MALQVWLPLTRDLSNQGLSGVSVTNNGATVNDNGKLGKCYYFNGDAQYLQLSSTLGDLYSHDFSYSVWLKPSDSTRSIIMSDYASSGASGVAYELTTSRSIRLYWNGSPDIYPTNCVLPLDTWSHTAIVKTTNRVDFYVNGELRHTYTGTLVDRVSTSCLRIGDDYRGGSSVSYMGYMNDVRIYNHALSAKEVKGISKGLVAHYKLSDSNIEGTTNISNKLSETCYNGATGVYNYGSNSDMYKDRGVFEGRLCDKVHMGTTGLSAYPYVHFANLHPANNAYKTLSFDYYPNVLNTVIFYTWGGTADASYSINGSPMTSFNSGSPITVTLNKWNHIIITLKGTSDSTGGWGYMRIGSTSHTSNTSNYWLFANVQLEEKDHATAYTDTSRTDGVVYDCGGYNYHGILNTSQTINPDTARYSVSTNFNGTDNAIKIPFNKMLGLTEAGKREYTISVWTYKTSIGSKGYQTIIGGPSGFELEARNASGTDPQYVTWNWGKVVGAYEFNKWEHFCFVHSLSDSKMYVNGVLQGTGSSVNVPIGDFFIGSWRDVTSQNYQGSMSDFRVYATALTADDVKELYQTGASIDNKGNIYAYELREL